MRLIDADALMKLARNNINKTVNCNEIAWFPTIEAEPVRHGEWRKYHDEIYCSLCECTALMGTYGGIIKSTYCPHCGARMDGGTEE